MEEPEDVFPDAEIRVRAQQDAWTVVSIKRGEEFKGILAGKIRRVYCHHDGVASKPCRSEITGGAVKCYCEKTPTKGRVYGYAPFITKDGSQVVVMLSATTYLKCRAFTKGTCLKLYRPDRDKAALVPHMLLNDALGCDLVKKVTEGKSADIAYYLLVILWHDEVLVKHFYPPFDTRTTSKFKPVIRKEIKDTDTPIPRDKGKSSLSALFTDGIGRPDEVPKLPKE